MKLHIIMAPDAVKELEEIREYITNILKNPVSAQRITDEIFNAIGQLAESPELGASFSFRVIATTSLRYLVVGNYIVVYRVVDDCIRIIHIFNGRRDYLNPVSPGVSLSRGFLRPCGRQREHPDG